MNARKPIIPAHSRAMPIDIRIKACFDNRLLLERGGRNGNVVRVLCPIIISQQECEEMIKRFTKSLVEALAAVRG